MENIFSLDINLDNLQEIFGYSIIANFMSIMHGFSNVIGGWVAISDQFDDYFNFWKMSDSIV